MASIISYAGLDGAALLSQSARLIADHEQLPERFRLFFPLFPSELVVDMPYVRGHFACDGLSYHQVLMERIPRLYEHDLRQNGVVTVDANWAALFPQYQPFQGERLFVYLIGGGSQGVPVPESLWPRAGAYWKRAEEALGVTRRSRHFAQWLKQQLEAGRPYDMDVLESEYLAIEQIAPTSIRQRDLGRLMQEISIARALEAHTPAPVELYTESGKRCEHVPQYVPFHTACDCFEPVPVTRDVARLFQLSFGEEVGDLWLPYADAAAYIDRRKMTLNVRALCEGFQIAPACDRAQRGGVYPDHVRVAVIRDHSVSLMAAQTLNNPAYGSGMNPQGMFNRLLYVPDSAALLASGKLGEERMNLSLKNDRVDEAEYLHMRFLAEWQEHKGRLIDAMYRRESALSQLIPSGSAYERACELLDRRVERFRRMVDKEPPIHGPRSAYDADIEYLRRKAVARAQVHFTPDEEREKCIESGYAMRSRLQGIPLNDLLIKPDRPARTAREKAEEKAGFEQVSMFEGAAKA